MECSPHHACSRAVSLGGWYSSCAIIYDANDERGQLKCWGLGGAQLGLGDNDDRGDQVSDMGTSLPTVNVGSDRFVVAVSTGFFHTCAVLDNNKVKCWGMNMDYQLGYGDQITRGLTSGTMGDALPFVELGTDYAAVDVCVSGKTDEWGYSCALSDAGIVKCWGSGHVVSETIDSNFQVLGVSPLDMGDNLPRINLGTSRYATQISCSRNDVCVILDNADIKCWGRSGGKLGHSESTMGDNLIAVDMTNVLGVGDTTPVYVDGGPDHFCVLLLGGAIACWGDNSEGQTGDTSSVTPIPKVVSIGTGRTAKQVATGKRHTCALLDDDSVKCWGFNWFAQLGLGDYDNHNALTNQMGDNLATVSLSSTLTTLAIYAGDSHSCALLSDHKLRCWGGNSHGVLGIGED
ncbi:regulator of chromosome condensation 1/beta-lactamase-inhibitor protein II, partial [Baffinella frigidus]